MIFDAKWWSTLRLMLRYDEGVRYKPYDDANGKVIVARLGRITIGIGRNLEDKGITDATVLQMLDEDIEDAIKAASEIFSVNTFLEWSMPRQHAVINMIFQLGATGFAKFKTTIAAMKRGDWEAAAKAAEESLWARQVPQRATRVLRALREEVYPYPGLE